MEYIAFARSAIGSTHRISNLPNQDRYRISCLPFQEGQRNNDLIKAWVISIADGHGSSRCQWSHIGAQLAVDVFYKFISEIYSESPDDMTKFFENISTIRHEIMPKRIVKYWQESVMIDYDKKIKRNPVLPPYDAINLLKSHEIYEQYGTTLIGLVLTEDFYFATQIGDGDILAVSQGGFTDPVLKMERLLGVETKSLSSKEAWMDFESIPIKPQKKADMPSLFLLSTDGLANSYSRDVEFHKIGSDYLSMLKRNSIDQIKGNLCNILHRTSIVGSGDDITLAMAVNINKIALEIANAKSP